MKKAILIILGLIAFVLLSLFLSSTSQEELISIIIGLIITILVLISIIRQESKKAEKYRKDWEFCRELLMKERKKIKDVIYQNTQQKEKQENKEKILQTLRQAQGKITNNDIEKLLNVSDATAERYLNELEKENKIEQIGKTGRSVFYKLK